MSMSRKDYNEIAEAIANVRTVRGGGDAAGDLVDHLAREVASAIRRAGNSNLNTQRFLEACGVAS